MKEWLTAMGEREAYLAGVRTMVKMNTPMLRHDVRAGRRSYSFYLCHGVVDTADATRIRVEWAKAAFRVPVGCTQSAAGFTLGVSAQGFPRVVHTQPPQHKSRHRK